MKNTLQKYKFNPKRLVWLFPLSVAVLIFCLSAQPGDESSRLSSGLIFECLKLMSKIFAIEDFDRLIDLLSLPVRKAAHVSEYLLLFISLVTAFRVSEVRGKRNFLFSLLITFLYACTDEFHQIFVPGRAGRFTDVLIDISAASLLTASLILFPIIRKKVKK